MDIEEKIRILILEDNKADMELNKLELKKSRIEIHQYGCHERE